MSKPNQPSVQRLRAFSLLEIILVVVIISTVAAVSLQYFRPTGEAVQQRSCDVTRQLLQNYADRYFSAAGSWPSRDLNEIATATLAGGELPPCPCDGSKYEMSGALVICPIHESTRR